MTTEAKPITNETLENWFTYHAPKGNQVERYQRIRDAGLVFARIVLWNTLPGEDQAAALRKIREAVMTANAAIACGEGAPQP
jgi:hypothetical protein